MNPCKKPAWGGPYSEGITFSLLNKILVCKERARILLVLGLRERETFNHHIEYGNLWHAGEEAFAQKEDWKVAIGNYHNHLMSTYPEAQDKITYWTHICLAQFRAYVEFRNRDTGWSEGRSLVQEFSFKVPYKIDHRTVILRGKFDGVTAIRGKIYLQERKTKGEVDEVLLSKTLLLNLQVQLYLLSLQSYLDGKIECPWLPENLHGTTPDGIIYTVIRRPLADRFAIRKRKGESDKTFANRVYLLVKSKPSYFFLRLRAPVRKVDMRAYRKQVIRPMLKDVCNWWDLVTSSKEVPWGPQHYQTPFGLYNPLDYGRRGEYFDYLTTGSTKGLVPAKTFFPELSD